MKSLMVLTVNGQPYELAVEPTWTLLEVIREQVGLLAAKEGCSTGDCGACTVLLNGKPVASCLVLAIDADGAAVTTTEALAQHGQLHPLQEAFATHGAVQCGYCTSGMLLSAKALLDENPTPSEHEVRSAIAGNLCRCTGYKKIVEAILAVAESAARRA